VNAKWTVAAIAGLALAGLAAGAACDDGAASHIYVGREYEQGRGCLDPPTSLDVVSGADAPPGCAPKCILSLPDDSGTSILYVSAMCPPYPEFPYELDAGSDPRCSLALALYASDVTCLDGGVEGGLPDAGDGG
jgi:hypothetical protein